MPPFEVNGWLGVALFYGAGGAVVLAGSLATVSVLMRDVTEIRRTVSAMAVLLPLAGLRSPR